MIIVSIIAVVAVGAALYFVVQNGKLSSIIEDKEMVANALRAQVEADKLKIASLKLEVEMSHQRSANKPVEVQKASAPRRRPAKKSPKQD
jgi:hypothetical protein